jgi:ferredoxin
MLMSETHTLRVHVDPDKCQGHNRCKLAAPVLFVLDEYGYASEVGDGIVPADQMAQARLARANCPEFAVSLRRPE